MAGCSKKVIFAELAGNSQIAITKFGAAAITGSAALTSEGVHSLVDTGNQGLLLLGLKRAERPAGENHPFGYGKEVTSARALRFAPGPRDQGAGSPQQTRIHRGPGGRGACGFGCGRQRTSVTRLSTPGQRRLVALFLDGLAPFLLRFVKRLLHGGGTVKRLQRLR